MSICPQQRHVFEYFTDINLSVNNKDFSQGIVSSPTFQVEHPIISNPYPNIKPFVSYRSSTIHAPPLSNPIYKKTGSERYIFRASKNPVFVSSFQFVPVGGNKAIASAIHSVILVIRTRIIGILSRHRCIVSSGIVHSDIFPIWYFYRLHSIAPSKSDIHKNAESKHIILIP